MLSLAVPGKCSTSWSPDWSMDNSGVQGFSQGRTGSRRQLSAEEFHATVRLHKQWLDSKGLEGKRADLRGCRLPAELSLKGIDLRQADLSGALLKQIDLRRARLEKANLTAATLIQVNLAGARLNGADLTGAQWQEVDGTRARLKDVSLVGARLSVCSLRRANLSRADLTRAMLEKTDCREATLHQACCMNADFSRINLAGAELSDANLTRARLSSANLGDADLRHVRGLRLDQTFIRNARFSPVPHPCWAWLADPVRWLCGRKPVMSRHSDAWSVLRQLYAGPRVLFLLLAFLLFALPYAARAVALIHVAHMEKSVAGAASTLEQSLKAKGVKLNEFLGNSPTPLTNRVKAFQELHGESQPLWQAMLPRNFGFADIALAILLVIYKAVLFFLVRRVGPMRDEEERSGYSPAWSSYRGLLRLHQVASVLFLVAVASFTWNMVRLFTMEVWVPY